MLISQGFPKCWTISLTLITSTALLQVNDVTNEIIVYLKQESLKGWNGPSCCRQRQRHTDRGHRKAIYICELFLSTAQNQFPFCWEANQPKIAGDAFKYQTCTSALPPNKRHDTQMSISRDLRATGRCSKNSINKATPFKASFEIFVGWLMWSNGELFEIIIEDVSFKLWNQL